MLPVKAGPNIRLPALLLLVGSASAALVPAGAEDLTPAVRARLQGIAPIRQGIAPIRQGMMQRRPPGTLPSFPRAGRAAPPSPQPPAAQAVPVARAPLQLGDVTITPGGFVALDRSP